MFSTRRTPSSRVSASLPSLRITIYWSLSLRSRFLSPCTKQAFRGKQPFDSACLPAQDASERVRLGADDDVARGTEHAIQRGPEVHQVRARHRLQEAGLRRVEVARFALERDDDEQHDRVIGLQALHQAAQALHAGQRAAGLELLAVHDLAVEQRQQVARSALVECDSALEPCVECQRRLTLQQASMLEPCRSTTVNFGWPVNAALTCTALGTIDMDVVLCWPTPNLRSPSLSSSSRSPRLLLPAVHHKG